jgi:hypothetical protein
MSTATRRRPHPPPGKRKRLTAISVGMAAAVITATAAIAAAVIQTYGHAFDSSGPATAPAKTRTRPLHTGQPGRVLHSRGGATRPETDEYPVTMFASYAGPTGIMAEISSGQVVEVICRVPGDTATPASVGSAGWYKIRNRNGALGFAAANCFYNDPGDGYGMQPNRLAYDPAAPIC